MTCSSMTCKHKALCIDHLITMRQLCHFVLVLGQIRRAERGEVEMDETRQQLFALLRASDARNVGAVLDAQASALLHLSSMGELLVPKFPFQVC